MTALERDNARLRGEHGALVSSVAQTKGKVTETELQVIQIDQDLRSEDGKELSEIRGKISELVEKQVAAEDQLKRVDLHAPQDGKVHQLSVHTIGGVVTAGDPIMLIVPEEKLIAEVRIAPNDIDQIRVGQRAVLRFPAFNQRTTPELNGEVSADLGRRHAGPEDQRQLLYRTHRHLRRGARSPRRICPGAGHARRCVPPDRCAHRDVVPPEARDRPGHQGLARALNDRPSERFPFKWNRARTVVTCPIGPPARFHLNGNARTGDICCSRHIPSGRTEYVLAQDEVRRMEL